MERGVFEIVDTESLVPANHLLRKIDAAVDFGKIYDMVEPLYCADNGRPSVDPVVLFKMVLIQHLYGLTSLRRTAEEVSLNVAYRSTSGCTRLGKRRLNVSLRMQKSSMVCDILDTQAWLR